jgi:hypothetical protein
VRRHVVIAFLYVTVQRPILSHEPSEKALQIALHVWIGVFLDDQGSAGMPAERRQQSGRNPLRGEPCRDLAGDLEEPLAVRAHAELALRLPQRTDHRPRYPKVLFRVRHRHPARIRLSFGRSDTSSVIAVDISRHLRGSVSRTGRRALRGLVGVA